LLTLAADVGLPREDVGIFIPGSKEKKYNKMVEEVTDTRDLDEAFYTKKVVFSTYGACRDGNNRLDLDFLVMYTPTTNPEQAVGRVLRLMDGKKRPIVIDLVDTEGPEVISKSTDGERVKTTWFRRSAKKRKEIYDRKKWEVEVKDVTPNV
jgi:hypothetical protein